MDKLSRTLALWLFAVALSACTESRLEGHAVQVGMPAAQVDKLLGAPDARRSLPDGSVAAYYVNGPSGWTTWRVVLDADSRVKEVQQVLDAAHFRTALIPGVTTRTQALDALGPPGLVTSYKSTNDETLIYRWMEITTPMRVDLNFDLKTAILKTYNSYWDPCPNSALFCNGTR